jgi:predicted glycogen debranching enzyme
VIAGYHWFSDWGRDTMISLPGLTLCTGRFDIAKDILITFLASLSEGMLPNRFPDRGETPEYNTVDATLWLFHAAHQYWQYSGDDDFIVKTVYPALREVIDWHVRGTRHGIRMDSDGLLHAGAEGVQLTWMDAKVGDWVVTPRTVKPVEIQALWYNALCIIGDIATAANDSTSAANYAKMAGTARTSFNQQFLNEDAGCLYDVLAADQPDASIRPNQLFAISLPNSVLDRERWESVIAVCRRDLLTPMGLRTLSPRDAKYIGRYEGDAMHRDGAYHQGTVWPWLIGPFITAYVKSNSHSASAKQESRALLEPLLKFANDSSAGQIAEVFDGDSPQRPGGCLAQAWSVAEVLRCYMQDICDSHGSH